MESVSIGHKVRGYPKAIGRTKAQRRSPRWMQAQQLAERPKELRMDYAIIELERALDTVRTNEPINRAEGKSEQAALEVAVALDIERALAVLRPLRRSLQ